ncbi:hypothetical protein GBA52_024694 [Prunus armeniaca]|nr:hypothetical protein GBA52_024694 [Prunus armeniaca]
MVTAKRLLIGQKLILQDSCGEACDMARPAIKVVGSRPLSCALGSEVTCNAFRLGLSLCPSISSSFSILSLDPLGLSVG